MSSELVAAPERGRGAVSYGDGRVRGEKGAITGIARHVGAHPRSRRLLPAPLEPSEPEGMRELRQVMDAEAAVLLRLSD